MADTVRHGIVQTELMSATDDRSRMRSFKYGTLDAATKELTGKAIDNGNVVELVPNAMLDRDLWASVTPKATTNREMLALVATPEIMYDERQKNLWEFYNEPDEACTGMLFKVGDVFSVTEEALDFTGTIAAGDFVDIQASTRLKITKTQGAATLGQVLDITIRKDGTYIGILVIPEK